MAQTKVLIAPTFQQQNAGDVLVCLTGQADEDAVALGDLLGGAVAPVFDPVTGITAAASGTQADATLLTGVVNQVDTVAGAADSVALPLAQIGLRVTVINTTATSMQVFGSGTDTINGVATATGVVQAGGTTKTYYCTKAAPAGAWFG